MLFTVLGLVLLMALAVAFVFWWRETRRAGQRPSWRGLAIPLLVVALAGLGYLTLGLNPRTPAWVAEQHRYAAVAEKIIQGQAPDDQDKHLSAADLARVLQARLVREPSAPGWYTLGLLYDQLEAPVQVQKAARRALELDPSNPSARLLLARGMIEQAQGKLTDDAYKQIQIVLADNPDHDGAWMLQAMAAGQAHRYGLAAEAWRQLLKRHDNGEAGKLIRQGLTRAEQQQTRGRQLDGLTVRVRGGMLPAGGTLFVFLRENGQGGQPLAARRVLVAAFPATVTLRARDWLQRYPDDLDGLRVAARYTPAPGSSVAQAGIRSATQSLSLGNSPAATLELAPEGAAGGSQ